MCQSRSTYERQSCEITTQQSWKSSKTYHFEVAELLCTPDRALSQPSLGFWFADSTAEQSFIPPVQPATSKNQVRFEACQTPIITLISFWGHSTTYPYIFSLLPLYEPCGRCRFGRDLWGKENFERMKLIIFKDLFPSTFISGAWDTNPFRIRTRNSAYLSIHSKFSIMSRKCCCQVMFCCQARLGTLSQHPKRKRCLEDKIKWGEISERLSVSNMTENPQLYSAR